MSTLIYIKCLNCGKLNPIPPTEAVKEHTCLFCGTIIPPQQAGKHEDAAKNKGPRKFPVEQSEHKPINRNMRKPMF
jgi:ribosomal protein S27E